MRLTPEEYRFIKEKSAGFQSVSHYIRKAIGEYSEVDSRARLALIKALTDLCVEYRNSLAWMGSNLNQAMKRANELAIAGLLSADTYNNTVLPQIREANKWVQEVRKRLLDLAKIACKIT